MYKISYVQDSSIKNVRGSDAALEVSQCFLWGQEVIILVFEVIELQVSSSIHP